MPKINFKSTAFHSITQEPEFCQIHNSDWWLNINNNTSFHFRLFPGKIYHKIFQEIQKTLFWGSFLAIFAQI